MHLGAR
ncbi:hypothetical protein LINPERPRIM_LOCUS37846 [Linum perenne]